MKIHCDPSPTSVLFLFCSYISVSPHKFLFFCRFGLSNRFDTEFPSVLTGKVQLLFFQALSLQTHKLLSVQFQVGRIKQ